MKKLIPAPYELLSKQLKRVQRQNPSYSLRALARDLKLSVSFASGILSGQRPFPRKHLERFVKVLGMDPIARELLAKALDREHLKTTLSSDPEGSPASSAIADFAELPNRDFSVLRHWYFVAILDLAVCEKNLDGAQVAKRLGIRTEEAAYALKTLQQEGWLKWNGTRWEKAHARFRLPTKDSQEIVRKFHRQMIVLALQELGSAESANFQKRLINGLTFSANPAQMERAKARLNEALYEIAGMLAQGECTEVYQLNCQLFPLTKSAWKN